MLRSLLMLNEGNARHLRSSTQPQRILYTKVIEHGWASMISALAESGRRRRGRVYFDDSSFSSEAGFFVSFEYKTQ